MRGLGIDNVAGEGAMGVPMIEPQIRQSLFNMTTADGTDISFAILEDERCAILCNGKVAAVRDSDELSLGRAVKLYFNIVEANGGARHPFQVEEMTAHPHAG
jgi:hypothetical protein